mmetsp:Transcript_7879/g.18416  ORF Transcript_7879/g.18416 Transcript_7879/m.18416 type:complete len:351 (+) Transcript_7879:86-1138(+)
MFRRKNESEPSWDQDFEPLMKILLGKKGIKTKSAPEVGKKKVDYFRGKDFKKFLLENEELLKRKCSNALKAALNGSPPSTDKDVEAIGNELLKKEFCYKAVYKPINPTSSKSESGSEKKVKKWPDRLARTPNQTFDCEQFYVITYEGNNGMQHFLLALIILGVLLVCMFPVWPMWAKIGIWYLTVIFLTLYFGVLILRMVIFTMFWTVGFDFWIFPNLNDEYCGFLDSFQPFYSWEKRKDDLLMLAVRFGSVIITAAALEQISQTHSLSDVQDFVQSSWVDVIDWGVDKITALPGSDKAALPSLDQLQKESEEDNGTVKKSDGTIEAMAEDVEDDYGADEGETIDADQSE